jgi:putative addiction module component (TIGR02574 family)
MSTPLERLEAEVLALPPGERARLARRLIESLDIPDDGDEDPTEVEIAWEAEIRRRLSEYDAGAVQAIPAAEVFAELRAESP